MKIAIGCDHAGFPYKDAIKKMVENRGHKVEDYGTDSTDSVDYPDFVHPVAKRVEEKKVRFGILICGSGNGVAMTANKHPKIRAAICWNPDLAVLARQHNNANVICIPARFISRKKALDIVGIFLDTKFEGGRHARRVRKISLC
ncbi:MAG: ribose 5-phosphate isomerase B [Saprospiraceae bacterium]|nr:ribose 5-phosphate isomerase B [Saprospiraceae bacterium]